MIVIWTAQMTGVPESGGEPNVWRVTPGALLGRDLTIEPDLSNAQPFLAAALVTGGRVLIPDWPARTTQPGDRLREIFTEMGGSCELADYGLVFTGSGSIHGIDVDIWQGFNFINPNSSKSCGCGSSFSA